MVLEGGQERILGDDGGNGGNDGREMAGEGGGSDGERGGDRGKGGVGEPYRKAFGYVLFNDMEFI